MVALSVTASQVQPSTTASIKSGIAAEAITAGQTVYVLTAGTIGLCDCDGTAPANTCAGIAVNDAAARQKVSYQTNGTITIGAGASIAAGDIFYAGPTAGSIVPEADVASGDNVIYLGVGNSSNGIVLNIHNSGVAHA